MPTDRTTPNNGQKQRVNPDGVTTRPSYQPYEEPGLKNPRAAPKPARFLPKDDNPDRKGTITGCGDGKKLKTKTCEQLHKLLHDLIHNKGHGTKDDPGNRGLIERFLQMCEDAQGLGYKTGHPHQTHVDQYYTAQCRLQQVMHEINSRGRDCHDPPWDAQQWAKQPAPTYRDFKDYQEKKGRFAPATVRNPGMIDQLRRSIGEGVRGVSNGARAAAQWGADNAWWIVPSGIAAGAILLAPETGGASLLAIPGCASPDTAIATPDGERPIASICPGDHVLAPSGGHMQAVPVLAVSRRPVRDHHVIEVELSNGRRFAMSAVHPLADGRPLSALRPGDLLSGVEVTAMTLIPYEHEHTHDILPDSDGGVYIDDCTPEDAARRARAWRERSIPGGVF